MGTAGSVQKPLKPKRSVEKTINTDRKLQSLDTKHYNKDNLHLLHDMFVGLDPTMRIYLEEKRGVVKLSTHYNHRKEILKVVVHEVTGVVPSNIRADNCDPYFKVYLSSSEEDIDLDTTIFTTRVAEQTRTAQYDELFQFHLRSSGLDNIRLVIELWDFSELIEPGEKLGSVDLPAPQLISKGSTQNYIIRPQVNMQAGGDVEFNVHYDVEESTLRLTRLRAERLRIEDNYCVMCRILLTRKNKFYETVENPVFDKICCWDDEYSFKVPKDDLEKRVIETIGNLAEENGLDMESTSVCGSARAKSADTPDLGESASILEDARSSDDRRTFPPGEVETLDKTVEGDSVTFDGIVPSSEAAGFPSSEAIDSSDIPLEPPPMSIGEDATENYVQLMDEQSEKLSKWAMLRRRLRRSKRRTHPSGNDADSTVVPDESRPTTAATAVTARNVLLELFPPEETFVIDDFAAEEKLLLTQHFQSIENIPEIEKLMTHKERVPFLSKLSAVDLSSRSFLITVFSVDGKGKRQSLGQAIAPLMGLELDKDVTIRRPLSDLTVHYSKNRENLSYAHLLHELRDAYVAHTIAKAPQAIFGGSLLNENKRVRLSCRKAGCSSKRLLYNGKMR